MPRRLLLLTALLAALLPGDAVAGDEAPDRLGPLPARTRNPLYVTQLQPSFAAARVLAPGRLSLSFEMDWANIYDKWQRIDEGGARRRGRIDMELVRPSAQVRVGLPRGVDVGIEVPLVLLTGGIGDSIIQGWHAALRAENGGREKVANNSFVYDVGVPGLAEKIQPRPSGLQLGDLVAEVRWQVLRPTPVLPGVVVRGLLKFPTGSAELGAGSGSQDVALVASAEHGIGPLALHAQVGVTVFGQSGPLAPILLPAAVSAGLALELIITRHWSMIAQLSGSSPYHHGFFHPWLANGPLSFTFGTRLRFGPVDIALGMHQDATAVDPSSDVAVVLRTTVRR